MPPPLKYRGVYFCANRTLNQWRAQIGRRGVNLVLGHFATPEEAARASDNASHYLREWATMQPLVNFPKEVEGTEPTPATLRAEAKLKLRFPNWLNEKVAQAAKSDEERVMQDALVAAEAITRHTANLRYAFNWALSQVKLQAIQIFQLKEEVNVQKRIVAGLRATGGHNPFRPMSKRPKAEAGEKFDDTPIPTTPVAPPPPVADHLA